MTVDEMFLPDEQDFRHFKAECTIDDGWTTCYETSVYRVSTKKNTRSAFDIVRIQSEFSNISSEVLYDVIHDGQFRSTWDTAMLQAYEICSVSSNSDIGYYSVKSPPPFKNRDFVTQRCWLDRGHNEEKYIINHSINHLREPPRKNFVRGISYLTGHLIIPTGSSSCKFYYMTQCDPGGSLPAWIVNRSSKVLVPKIITKLAHACTKYDKWKSKNQPSYKPWLHPEQMTNVRLNPMDIGIFPTKEILVDSSEASVRETAMEMED